MPIGTAAVASSGIVLTMNGTCHAFAAAMHRRGAMRLLGHHDVARLIPQPVCLQAIGDKPALIRRVPVGTRLG